MNKKLVYGIILIILIVIAGYLYNISTEQSNNVSQTEPDVAKSYIYAKGDIEATVVDLVIKETNVDPVTVKITDSETGEVSYGPSTFYSVDIKLKVNSIRGIESEFLNVGDEIIIDKMWEPIKPNFEEGDAIEASVELFGISLSYDPNTGHWRFEGGNFPNFK